VFPAVLLSFGFYRAMLSIRGTSHGPVSVCLSVTSRCSTKTAERIELVFGMRASSHASYTVLKGNSVISKNNGTSVWNFVLNSGTVKMGSRFGLQHCSFISLVFLCLFCVVVHFLRLVNACFGCVRLSFLPYRPRDWLGETPPK